MMFAETASSRPLVNVAAMGAGLIAGMVIALTSTPTEPPPQQQRVRTPITPMRGCAERAARVAPPARVHHGDPTLSYRDVLVEARDRLQACVTGDGVGYRLALVIAPTGKVSSVEVKADAEDISQIDLKAVRCLERAVSPLAFPQAPHDVRMSTYISPR